MASHHEGDPRDYPDVVAALESRGIMPDRPPGLETVQEGLRRLDLRIDPERVIVVAGTNGKGSVCASLEALLLSAGRKAGLYTSPHLVETTERIRIGGRDIAPGAFLEAFRSVDSVTRDLRLSHFETLTLMAAWEFFKDPARLDWVVLEVGLGGLWDATNAVPHRHAVITTLALDHENLLGRALPEIARNKFGIVSPGARVVHGLLPAETLEEARATRERTRSRWSEARIWPSRVDARAGLPRFWIDTGWGPVRLALPGRRGAENSSIALAAFESLGFDPAPHLGALARVRWPGRMERIRWKDAQCPVFASGDHNPQGISSLLELLPFYPRERLHLLAGVGRDKDLSGILDPLLRLPDASLYLTETPFKGRRIEEYGTYLERASGAWADGPRALTEICRLAGPDDLIVVTGSLYLVGEVKRRLANHSIAPPEQLSKPSYSTPPKTSSLRKP